MVTVTFKLTDAGSVQLEVSEPQTLENLLNKCTKIVDINLGGFIAVRNGTVITAETPIENGDTIDIFPAISGG